MLKILSLFFLLGLVACATDPKYAVKEPLLYEVSKGSSKAYLFGTVHLGVHVDDLPEEFWPYFDKADAFAMEIDTLAPETKGSRAIGQNAIKTSEQKSLRELLTPEETEQFKKLMLGESKPEIVERMPDTLNSFGGYVFTSYAFSKRDRTEITRSEHVRLQSKFMMDSGLQKRAVRLNKIMTFLDGESEEQIAKCFASNDEKNLREMRKLLAKPPVEGAALIEFNTLIAAYRTGDEKFFHDFDPEIDDCLLKDRNLRWMPKIISNIEVYERPFVAVGLAHLLTGDDNLIKLLRDRGYTVTRVKFNSN